MHGESGALPWDELREMLGCILGAALHERQDRDVVLAYVDWLIHPELLQQQSSVSIGKVLSIPTDPTWASHKAAVDSLRAVDVAEFIGIHSNAERRVQVDLAIRITSTVERMFVGSSIRFPLLQLQQLSQEVLHELPSWAPSDLAMLHAEAGNGALSQFLFDEVTLFNAFLKKIRGQLEAVHVAASVEEVGEDLAYALRTHQPPASWQHGPLVCGTLRQWVQRVVNCHRLLYQWSTNGLPAIITIGCLSRPTAFIAAFVVDACKSAGLPLEAFGPKLHVTQPHESLFGAYPSLRLSGACIDGARLDESGLLSEPLDMYSQWWADPVHKVSEILLTLHPLATSEAPDSGAQTQQQKRLEFSRKNSCRHGLSAMLSC